MKSMLCRLSRYILLLFVSFSSLIAQGQNLSWDGEWTGMSTEGDARVSVSLNIVSKDTLNPYNEESLCNGFISIMVKEPSGRESLLSTYELQLLNNNANQLEFAYSAGRPGMDQGSGKCVATQVNDTLRFQVTENNDGEAVLFEGIALTSDTVAIAADSEKSMPIMDIILAILAGGAYLAMLGHMVYVWIKGKRYKTKTYEDDHSQHWIAWILGLIVLITLAALMVFWAIINYLRNYIFYI